MKMLLTKKLLLKKKSNRDKHLFLMAKQQILKDIFKSGNKNTKKH